MIKFKKQKGIPVTKDGIWKTVKQLYLKRIKSLRIIYSLFVHFKFIPLFSPLYINIYFKVAFVNICTNTIHPEIFIIPSRKCLFWYLHFYLPFFCNLTPPPTLPF